MCQYRMCDVFHTANLHLRMRKNEFDNSGRLTCHYSSSAPSSNSHAPILSIRKAAAFILALVYVIVFARARRQPRSLYRKRSFSSSSKRRSTRNGRFTTATTATAALMFGAQAAAASYYTSRWLLPCSSLLLFV